MIMRSKAILSFGYKSFLNYYLKMSCFNTLRCCGRLFSCCSCFKVTKHSSMTARKYKRQANAQLKMNQELDLLEIVKTLRQARFLIDNTMTEQQKQLVDYFKIYSLETPLIKRDLVYSKYELFKSIQEQKDEPLSQKLNEQIMDKILMGKRGNLQYLHETDRGESSSNDSHVDSVEASANIAVDPTLLH